MIEQLRTFLNEHFGDEILGEDNFRDQQSFIIKPGCLMELVTSLYENPELDVKFLADITSVDWYKHAEESKGRFEVIYNLYSLRHSYRFFLKVRLSEDNPHIESLTPLWAGANWMEREVFDLMGITFDGHPDLTKILTADDLVGFPLRRDFPLTWEQPHFTWNKDDPPEVIT